MVQVCEGAKTKDEMMEQSIHEYKEFFVTAKAEFNKIVSVRLADITFPVKLTCNCYA